MLSIILVSASLAAERRPTDAVPLVYYVILTSYTMLPVTKAWSVGMGVAAGLVHLVTFWAIANTGVEHRFRQVQHEFHYSLILLFIPYYYLFLTKSESFTMCFISENEAERPVGLRPVDERHQQNRLTIYSL